MRLSTQYGERIDDAQRAATSTGTRDATRWVLGVHATRVQCAPRAPGSRAHAHALWCFSAAQEAASAWQKRNTERKTAQIVDHSTKRRTELELKHQTQIIAEILFVFSSRDKSLDHVLALHKAFVKAPVCASGQSI